MGTIEATDKAIERRVVWVENQLSAFTCWHFANGEALGEALGTLARMVEEAHLSYRHDDDDNETLLRGAELAVAEVALVINSIEIGR